MKQTLTTLMSIAFLTLSTSVAAGDATAGQTKFKSTCVPCHGSNAEGMVGPRLAGQPASDIIFKLNEYRAGKQRGPMTYMMAPMAQGLTETEIEDVAAYVSEL